MRILCVVLLAYGSTSGTLVQAQSSVRTTQGVSGRAGREFSQSWRVPACSQVSGTGAVTFTRNLGKTVAPASERLREHSYTHGLVTLDTPNTLLAAVTGAGQAILLSEDSGCHWRAIGNEAVVRLVAAAGGWAYGCALDTRSKVSLVVITPREVLNRKSPVDEIRGLGTDPSDGAHVRVVDEFGAIWDSPDMGKSWRKSAELGRQPGGFPWLVECAAFSPKDLKHVLIGVMDEGGFVSRDGGVTWQRSQGFAAPNHHVSAFGCAISPTDPQVVWVLAVDMGEVLDGTEKPTRLYRSGDGGLTFQPVLSEPRALYLPAGTVLAPHPSDRDVLYISDGLGHLAQYDFRKRQLVSKAVSLNVGSIAFSPRDPSLLYLGLSKEGIRTTTRK